jgi:hypothetical protein
MMMIVSSSDFFIESERVFEKYRLNPPNPLKKGEQESKSPFFKGDLGGLIAYDCNK